MDQPLEFEWDEEKHQRNIRIHRVDFPTASRVFLDPFILEYEDDRGYDELRWNALGMVEGKVLHVTYTMRGERYRIISAREAEPHERRKYHNL